MASYRILSSNDLRNHYFAIGKDEANKLNLNKRFTLICHGMKYPDRKIDISKGYGHVYARKDFFENHHLSVGDRLDFEINSEANTIIITITRHDIRTGLEPFKVITDVTEPTDKASSQKETILSYKNKLQQNYCTMVVIPRDEFKRNIDVDILKYPCLYILLSEMNIPNPMHYIGYTNNPIERITTHRSKSKGKSFWHYALVFLFHNPKDDTHFDISDVAYLEYLALNKSHNALRRFNSKGADEPSYIKPAAKQIADNAFKDIQALVASIGIEILK